MRILSGLMVVALLSASAPDTSAQLLDGQWFKASGTATGFGDDGESDKVTRAKVKKVTHYIRLVHDEGISSFTYQAQIWVEISDEAWEFFDSGTIDMFDANETLVATGSLNFYGPGSLKEGSPSDTFFVRFNGPSRIKLKNEELKSARITALGSTASGNTKDGVPFVGKARVSLSRVPESKLPFDPEELPGPSKDEPLSPHRELVGAPPQK
jgi:hypothetical protein